MTSDAPRARESVLLEGPGGVALRAALAALRPQLEALEAVGRAAPSLAGAWLAAGALRNRTWDLLLGGAPRPDRDWDVASGGGEAAEAALRARLPGPWEVVDQRGLGFTSAAAGLAGWPETATAVGARLGPAGLEVLAPWGLEDLLCGIARRAPGFGDAEAFERRRAQKGWSARWPGLTWAPWRPACPGEPRLTGIRLP